MDDTLESINRCLHDNQGRITRCNPSLAYYIVDLPIRAGHDIKAAEYVNGPNGFELSGPPQHIPVPKGISPITETEDGFVLNYKDGTYGGRISLPGPVLYRYGFVPDLT